MIELEKTYLAKSLPAGLEKCRHKEIVDIYLPENCRHPTLRIRKNGNDHEITKKEPVDKGDSSCQEEQTIKLTEEEFLALSKVAGKKVSKVRYFFEHDGRVAEIDVFSGALLGLVVVDFEFNTTEDKNAFEMPEFCLCEITQEEFIAGGMICGKSYEDVAKELERFGYEKLFLED
jgi:CYTH domain-containing protein